MNKDQTEVLNVDGKSFIPTPEDIDAPFFRACDVQLAAGLSYRQLNNWDSIGVLPNSRGAALGWRKFSYREVFALAVCSDIRSRFGVSLDALKPLQSYLLREDIDFLGDVRERMTTHLFAFYLLTDLRELFFLIPDVEFESVATRNLLRGDAPAAFILLKINPLLSRILLCLDTPARLKTSHGAYDTFDAKRQEGTVQNEQEREVLRLVREGCFDRISIQLKDGNIVRAEAEKEIPESQRRKLLNILNSRDFQTVTMTKQDGEIVRIRQKIPITFPQITEPKYLHRQKDPEGRGKA
jgi:hypothetical protein